VICAPLFSPNQLEIISHVTEILCVFFEIWPTPAMAPWRCHWVFPPLPGALFFHHQDILYYPLLAFPFDLVTNSCPPVFLRHPCSHRNKKGLKRLGGFPPLSCLFTLIFPLFVFRLFFLGSLLEMGLSFTNNPFLRRFLSFSVLSPFSFCRIFVHRSRFLWILRQPFPPLFSLQRSLI